MGKRFFRYLIILIMVLILNMVAFAQPGNGDNGGDRPNPPGMGNRSLTIEIDSTFELE